MALLMLALTSCSSKEIKLEFALSQDVTANYTLLYYASDKRGGMNVEGVATVQQGKGMFKGATVNPVLIYLYGGTKVPSVIYCKRGETIGISGPDRNPASWTVEGGDINRDLSLWRNAHVSTLANGTAKEINDAVEDFVRANPDNPVAPILLLTAFSRYDDETLFRELWKVLGEKSDKEKWLAMVGRADLLTSPTRLPGRLTSMVLRSLHNGVDTIRPATSDATILFFWNNGMFDRKELIDSLKTLAKEFPDSTKRLIADISLDADSLSWRSPLRSDSVKGITRLWVPAGLADSRLMDLGVTASPYFIVFSNDGHQRYRGQDVSAAFSTFRRLAKPTTDTVSSPSAETPSISKKPSSSHGERK